MPDYDLSALRSEFTALEKEVEALTRDYPIEAVADMRGGKPRPGATPGEAMARERFARMNEIILVLRVNERLALK
jgi:hypothetical protein